MSKQEIVIKRLTADAISGKGSALAKLLDLQMRLLSTSGDENASEPLSVDDASILDAFVAEKMKKRAG